MAQTTLRGQPLGNVADRLVNVEDRLRALRDQAERISERTGANGPPAQEDSDENVKGQVKTIRTHAGVLVGCQDLLDEIEATMNRIEGHMGEIDVVDKRPVSTAQVALKGRA